MTMESIFWNSFLVSLLFLPKLHQKKKSDVRDSSSPYSAPSDSPSLSSLVSFSIYDYDCDGFISKEELGHMLAATMREHEIILAPADVEGIIHSTFAEVRPSNPEKISFEE
jgi:hypothetical protein